MTYEKAHEIAASMLSERRLYHSECVAKCAKQLAERFGADPGRAEVAGILHDVMKEAEDPVLLKWMGGSAIIGDNDLRDLRSLWHAWAGAGYAERELGLDGEMADAIRYHTSGRAGMGPLEKTLFLADYISEDRTFEGSAEVREKAQDDPEGACLLALQFMICHLVSAGRVLDLNSPAAYDWFLRNRIHGND